LKKDRITGSAMIYRMGVMIFDTQGLAIEGGLVVVIQD
jgi:hypothetical protein